MKFRFKIQQYQTDAVNSVVSVFKGQPYSDGVSYRRDLGEVKPGAEQVSLFDTGYLNEALQLTDEQLLKNIRDVQQDNDIYQSASLAKGLGRCALDVEMETGTGKTYVYIKTMFELNKRYGWSKFIVVVPSIAIREGVKKSFEITVDHFMEHYGKKARFFIYSSANLNQLDSFSADSGINVMIINTQAFAASLKEDGKSKEARIIYSKRDEFQSRRPIDVIAANRPIIIMDEPQKMGGDVTQKALKSFNPLFTLNYSATHKERHNLIYVLDALDAYNKRLVKRIEVKGFEVKNFRGTDGYLYLESFILSPKQPPKVRMELEIRYNKSINRETRQLTVGATYISSPVKWNSIAAFPFRRLIPLMEPSPSPTAISSARAKSSAMFPKATCAVCRFGKQSSHTSRRKPSCSTRESRRCRCSSSTRWRIIGNTMRMAMRCWASSDGCSRKNTCPL